MRTTVTRVVGAAGWLQARVTALPVGSRFSLPTCTLPVPLSTQRVGSSASVLRSAKALPVKDSSSMNTGPRAAVGGEAVVPCRSTSKDPPSVAK